MKYVICLSCPDQTGIVAHVSGALHNHKCNIEKSAQFSDPLTGRFFMRIEITSPENITMDMLRDIILKNAQQFNIDLRIHPLGKPVKTIILLSKQDHCLNDLLYRWRINALNIDIKAVASNHNNSRDYVQQRGLPFYHFPITPETKAQQEDQIRNLIDETQADLIILARYMQILSDDFCNDYAGRVINIHHSFLPGFKGARPYHQAYERGVKMIGATAHFATSDLDEGPIITQNVAPITHEQSPSDLEKIGRDTENVTLAKAVDLFAQHKIFMHGNRTIIL